MRKFLSIIGAPLALVLLFPASALAHVIVTPDSATTGEWVAFSIGVPNEKNVATTSIKLEIPSGLTNVQPNVEAGWKISTTKTHNGAVSAITWSGNIPAGQRADLRFTAQTPASPKNLDWKAYQTYADGTLVSWDKNPDSNSRAANTGPYSITTVADNTDSYSNSSYSNSPKITLALILSAMALIFGTASLFRAQKHK